MSGHDRSFLSPGLSRMTPFCSSHRMPEGGQGRCGQRLSLPAPALWCWSAPGQ
ncbi:hypothetical protein STXM2123_3719 [Streptomyces sp. F-3]|nr:hypothetical protein STXM2123_3719 [Streptomyces sp. F-3]